MADDALIRVFERVIERGGTITTRAVAQVHPEMRALTLSQYRVLALVASSADGLRVGELARRSASAPQATGRIVRRLELQGLVWLERGGEADRRAVVVRLTDVGSRTWSEIADRRRDLLAVALEDLQVEPGVASALELIARALERYTA